MFKKYGVFLVILVALSVSKTAAQPFPCDGKIFFFRNDSSKAYLSYIEGYTTPFPTIGNLCFIDTLLYNQNALGANPKDGYLYFINQFDFVLYRVDAACTFTPTCSNLPRSVIGCFDHLGRYWIIDNKGKLMAFDINTCDTVKGPFTVPGNIKLSLDLTYNASDCHFYMVGDTASLKIDTNGVVSTFNSGFNTNLGKNFGGIAVGVDGNIYSVQNNTSSLIRFNTSTFTGEGSVYNFTGSTAINCGCDMASFPCPVLKADFEAVAEKCKIPNNLQINNKSTGLVHHFKWDFGDGSPLDSVHLTPTHTFTKPGIYTVKLLTKATSTCLDIQPDSATITVIIDTLPVASFSILPSPVYKDSIVCFDTDYPVSGTWLWDFENGNLSSDTIPCRQYSESGNYCVTFKTTNTSGCRDSATNCFSVKEKVDIIIPNIFTPDGDGKNDAFFIPNTGFKQLHCTIYNRWGLKIYELNTPQDTWEGRTTSGTKVPDGTYYYIYNATEGESGLKHEGKGFVTLTRTK